MFSSGQTVVLREVLHDRIRSARPLRVIADDEEFVGYLTPRSAVAWPRLIGTEQSQTPDQGWRLVDEIWQGPGSLFIIPAGEAFAAVLFFDSTAAEPISWKVDFMVPLRRTTVGFDTLDTALDLLAPLDRSSSQVKDSDDFAQLGRIGVLDEEAMTEVADARGRAEALLDRRSGPFDERWVNWRPDPTWGPLAFPDGWDRLGRPAAASATEGAVVRRSGSTARPVAPPTVVVPTHDKRPILVRSALGSEILDAEGRVWTDFDLGGGTLPLGHNHPAVIEAVTRQLTLLHRHPSAAIHESSIVIAERLLDRVGRGDRVRLTRSGAEAERLASTMGVPVHDARIDLGVGTTEPLVIFGEEHASGWPFGAVVGPAAAIGALDDDTPEPDPLALTAALETLHQLSSERTSELCERTKTWVDALISVGESGGFGVQYPGGWSVRLRKMGAELPLSVALWSRSIMHSDDLVLSVAETTSESALSRVVVALA